MARTIPYLGAFGYNESPEELGGIAGFWQFEDYAALEAAHTTSAGLDQVFETLDLPAHSQILWVNDLEGRAIFHVLVLSTRDDLYLRQYDLMELAVAWLKTQGHPELDPDSLAIAGITREMLDQQKQEHEVYLKTLAESIDKREKCLKQMRFLDGYITEEEYAAGLSSDDNDQE